MNDLKRELYEVIRKHVGDEDPEEVSSGTLLAVVQAVAEVSSEVSEELIDEVLDRL